MIKLLGFKIGEIVGSAFNDEIQIAMSSETIKEIIEIYKRRGIKAMRFSEVEYCVNQDGERYYMVFVSEVTSNTCDFAFKIERRLDEKGWKNVVIITEW